MLGKGGLWGFFWLVGLQLHWVCFSSACGLFFSLAQNCKIWGGGALSPPASRPACPPEIVLDKGLEYSSPSASQLHLLLILPACPLPTPYIHGKPSFDVSWEFYIMIWLRHSDCLPSQFFNLCRTTLLEGGGFCMKMFPIKINNFKKIFSVTVFMVLAHLWRKIYFNKYLIHQAFSWLTWTVWKRKTRFMLSLQNKRA